MLSSYNQGRGVASNLNDLYSQGLPMLPQPGQEIPNNLNDPYIISIARGLPKPHSQDLGWLIAQMTSMLCVRLTPGHSTS